VDGSVENKVRKILDELRRDGISALKRFSIEFDGFDGDFRVGKDEIINAEASLTQDEKKTVEKIMDRIREYHKRQMIEDSMFISSGSIYGILVRPIERIGIYVPGGKPLPSTLMMVGVPARLAGVEEIVVVSPPKEGKIDPRILFIAKILEIEEIYKLGGAHAIGAMAFGIGMKKVDKIFGPGNQYVNEAKRQVFGIVGIDSLAGPSEVCIVADDSAKREYVMFDLLSQVEHGEGSKAWLLTTSKDLIEYCERNIEIPKGWGEIEYELFDDIERCMRRANELAPEHLELLVKNPLDLLKMVKNAGAVYAGEYTPTSAGDYFLGVNHVLPTGGTARFSSVLGLWDFVKRISFACVGRDEFMKNRYLGIAMADVEKMRNHGKALEVRE